MATGDVNRCRALLDEVLDVLAMEGREDLYAKIVEAKELTRRDRYKPVVARPRRGSLTPELAAQIRDFVGLHPNWNNRRIGAYFGVDGGRVSEALGSKKL